MLLLSSLYVRITYFYTCIVCFYEIYDLCFKISLVEAQEKLTPYLSQLFKNDPIDAKHFPGKFTGKLNYI